MKRFAAALGSIAVLGLLALPAGAGAVTTPTGGAANMLHDPTMGVTMREHVSPNGNQGMWCAVDVTNGYPTPPSPGSCPEG